MNQTDIIILNPFQISHYQKLLEIINTKTAYKSLYLEGGDVKVSLVDKPMLVIVFLSDTCLSNSKFVIENLLKQFFGLPIIGIIEFSTGNYNNSIIKKFIWNVITIPFTKDDVLSNIEQYKMHQPETNISIKTQLKKNITSDLLKGRSAHINEIKGTMIQVAPYEVNVLIKGETGCGKELISKMIHFLSPRSQKPFIPLNCGAIPKELFENELFGHRKGAYTHASDNQKGLIRSAQGGTLFLDEVESLSQAAQVKLLRFLEEKKYKPLGQSKYTNADVRIIAAAKENLWKLVKEKKFRGDLFYRLNVFQIKLLPLRERPEDISVLAEFFIKRYALLYKKDVHGVAPQAMLKLLHHDWPGNVRELQNVIRGAVIRNTSGYLQMDEIEINHFEDNPLPRHDESLFQPLKQAKTELIKKFEKKYLNNLMLINKGNISKAAKFAKKERSEFCRLLKKYNINADSYR